MLGFQKSKRFWVIAAAILLASSALVAVAKPARTRENGAVVFCASTAGSKLVAQRTNNGAAAVIITIRPTGFDPGEINSLSGRFRLTVDNQSGLSEVTVRRVVERIPFRLLLCQ